ncbi:transcription termination factor MTERF5, chloroplastic-like isoform X2 [Rhododendron vialii]|uniref:transcription termination factor MTERF5, chloroplastic-like isoform X2 n=1 Tax=Rhododendron vialii TaxID=182163 RepID=UPI00265F2466|nr:transcription termination factor MTERF5, chloroplastic-like isoform X2 [Rhododendron vialii]
MQTFPAIRSSDLSSLPGAGAAFFIPRTQLTFPKKLFFCHAKYAESGNAGLHNLIVAPANPLVAEKEEAKAVLTLFLKKRGLSNAVAAITVDKSGLFIDHLVSRLHSVHKNRYLGGQELTTLEIRNALNPYLETLYEEFGDILVDVVENFPNPATEERSAENLSIPSLEEEPVVPVSAPITTLNSKKLKALARLTDDGLTGKPPPHIIYLTALGMEIEVIKEVTSKFPSFAYYSLDRKIKPVVEVLLDLGIPKSDIPTILSKRPHLCGVRETEKLLIPTLTYLKNLGMDKKQLIKAIRRFPALLTCSRQKLESSIDLLYELGLPAENLGKVLTRGPQILGLSVETLKARAKYFHSLGVDVGSLLYRHPTIFALNIETHLKPLMEFFLERGFSTSDIASMISRFGSLYTFSLSNNIMPKWEFFSTMCYPKSDLVKFPQYFGYSLELRIKRRYAIMRESGVTLSLHRLLRLSDADLDEVLKQKMEKHVG